MRWCAAILMGVSVDASATTLFVDGVGSSPETFDTIRRALQHLGSTGLGVDGASDEVRVMVNALTEPVGFSLNGTDSSFSIWGGSASGEVYDPVRDDIVFSGDGDGDGTPCHVDVTEQTQTPYGTGLIPIGPATDQHITLAELILTVTPGSSYVGNFVTARTPYPGSISRAHLTFRNIVITAVLPGNVPQDPMDDGPRGWGIIDDGFDLYPVKIDLSTAGSSPEIAFDGCAIALQAASALRCDLAGGVVRFRNGVIRRNGNYLGGQVWVGDGIGIFADTNLELEVESTLFEGNALLAIYAVGPGDATRESGVTIGPGCWFVGNSITTEESDLRIEGTPDSRVVFVDGGAGANSSQGALAPGVRLQASHAILWNSRLSVRSRTEAKCHLRLSNCVFTEYPPYWSSYYEAWTAWQVITFRPVFQATAPGELLIENCTFDNIVTEGTTRGTPVFISSSMTGPAVIRNCVFSGTGGEYAVDFASAEFDNCAVVLEGPRRIHALNAKDPAAPIPSSVITSDPWYVTTDLASLEDAFDIQSVMYGHSGPGGGPLTGWGDYVGPEIGDLIGLQMR